MNNPGVVQGNSESPGVRAVIERRGLRCTRQRELIYAALAGTDSHPTAEELFTRVREGEPRLSLATVYNTPETFTSRWLARRIPCPSGSGPCRYDADVTQHVHVTMADGQVMDLPEDLSARLLGSLPGPVLAEVEQRLGIRVGAVNIQIAAQT